VTPAKGQDLLLEALVDLADLAWRCVCVGSLVDDGFAARIRKEARQGGVDDRFVLAGSLTGRALAARYAGADLLVLPSRAETYGMVVTEALARALPVAVSHVGGAPEALGRGPDGRPPGLLLPPDDATAWADGLRRWLSEPRLRGELRARAAARRLGLTGWDETARRMANLLGEVAR
jgi:glycosyltransferase involved in cell wall biosynthesis